MSAQLLIGGEVAHNAPELVLFDKDGTIIDIHHYWASMIGIRSALIVERWFAAYVNRQNVESRLIDAMGVDLQSGRMKPEGPVGIKPRPFIVNVAADVVREYSVEISNDEMEALFYEVDQITAEDLLPLLKLLPGVTELLKRLKEEKVVAMIVSTDITLRARKAMETLGLDDYFNDIIGADQVEHTKPAADLALLALERSGAVPAGAVVIGDHPVDVQMGGAAGVGLNIGVLTGLADMTAFEGMECRIVADLSTVEIETPLMDR